jgi:DNA polymerase IV
MNPINPKRSIIHINIADFAVAVERLTDGRLRGRPVIIAPEEAARATVYDMSEEAYQSGVRKGMPLRRARRLCRDARILPPHTARYEQAMADLLRQALPFSPLIEPGENDGHLFVDVSGTSRIFGPPVDVAWRLRRQAKTALRLDPIWSLAANKLVAKVASRLVKPLGEYIVVPGDEEAFLAPLPVWLIPGVEARDLIRLQEFNLTRVGQVTALGRAHLQMGFGSRADFLADALRGIDAAPVRPVGQQPPQVVLDHTFGTDAHAPAQVGGVLGALVERAGRSLRRQGRVARRVSIFVDYSDGRRCTRQAGVQPPTANDLALLPLASRALHAAWTRRVRIRHLRLICDRLIHPPAQMPLFQDDRRMAARRESIVAVMDRIRDRFGDPAVRLGRSSGDDGPAAHALR